MDGRPTYLEYRRRRGFQLQYSFRRTTEVERIRPNNALLRLVGKKHNITVDSSTLDMVYLENTADVSPDYISVVKTNIETASLSVGGEPADLTRDQDPTATYRTLKIDRFGRVVDSQGKGPYFHNGIYPDEQVGPGQSWNVVDNVTIPKVSQRGEVLGEKEVQAGYTYTCNQFVTVGKYKCAEIVMNGQYQEQIEMFMVRFYHQGTLMFSIRDGFVVTSNVRLTNQIVSGETADSTSVIDEVKLMDAGSTDSVGGMRI